MGRQGGPQRKGVYVKCIISFSIGDKVWWVADFGRLRVGSVIGIHESHRRASVTVTTQDGSSVTLWADKLRKR